MHKGINPDEVVAFGAAVKGRRPYAEGMELDYVAYDYERFDDPEVERARKLLPYKIVNKDGQPCIKVKIKDGEVKLFRPEEISAMILGMMRETAESYLGEKIKDVVLTVPAYFNDEQRVATHNAGNIAGLNIVHRVMDYFIKLIKNKYNVDISKDNVALWKLRKACENAKRELSGQHQVQVKSLFDGVDFLEPLTRAKFEELNLDLFKKTMGLVRKALDDAGLKKSDIAEVVLAGGSTRIPKVQQLLEDYFDGKEMHKGINPDEVVAFGAAVKGRRPYADSREMEVVFDYDRYIIVS